MNNVEIFTGPGCSYCNRAKDLLKDNNVPFVEIDISDPENLAEFKRRLPRVKSIPQIFVEGDHIGGFDDLVGFLK